MLKHPVGAKVQLKKEVAQFLGSDDAVLKGVVQAIERPRPRGPQCFREVLFYANDFLRIPVSLKIHVSSLQGAVH